MLATRVVTLVVPDWRPTRLNELMKHPFKAARLKRLDRDFIMLYAAVQRVPKATGKRRVSLDVQLSKGLYRYDPDAYWKSTLDALVHAGLLLDDRDACCELGPVNQTRGPKLVTTITLEDLP